MTIVNRFGKEFTGRAVTLGPAAWVLDMDPPMIATEVNVTRINEAKGPQIVRARRPDDAQKIADQFTRAFEGGSNYFLQTAKLMEADNKPTGRPWYACPEVFEGAFEIELGYDDPNGYEGNGAGRKVITDADVRHGLDVMARDYPDRFAAMMNDSGDTDTADVFLQCALFGKVVYG